MTNACIYTITPIPWILTNKCRSRIVRCRSRIVTTPRRFFSSVAVNKIRVVFLWFVCWSLSLQSSKHHLCKSNFYSSFSSPQAYSTTLVVMLHFTPLHPTDTLSVIIICMFLPPFVLSDQTRVNGPSVLYEDFLDLPRFF